MIQQNSRKAPRKVLVAEDESLVALDLVSRLDAIGLKPAGPACSGSEAIALAFRERPDLALLDIHMPGPDGLFVADEIWRCLDIPSVIISAYSTASYISRADRAGVFAYLVKPVGDRQLHAALGVAWGRVADYRVERDEAKRLSREMDNRKAVESAKWVLVQNCGLSEPDALDRLRRVARASRRPMAELAREVLERGPGAVGLVAAPS